MEFTSPAPTRLRLTVGEHVSAQPVEVNGRYARFDVELGELLREPATGAADLTIVIDDVHHDLPFPAETITRHRPAIRAQAWPSIVSANGVAKLVINESAPQSVVTHVTSTPTGLCVNLDRAHTGIEMRCASGERVSFENLDGECHIEFTPLLTSDRPGPVYWRAFAVGREETLPLVIDNLDLKDASTAYYFPMLIVREGDVDRYAKPYFARGSGQLSVRTGIKAEKA